MPMIMICTVPFTPAAPVLDALLAATALVHDLTLVTRDHEGFKNTGVKVLNPFKT
jgi:toxin FitB